MDQVNIIGIDLAKHSFQLHGARADGSVAFRKKLSRGKVLEFLASQPPSVVAMEACASAHYWGRETEKLGHEAKLVPPIYVKPFVKRQKNDTTDAEATSEAAQRPTMELRGREDGRAASPGNGVPYTRFACAPADADDQCTAGLTWRSSASSRRRDPLMLAGWHRHSMIRTRVCRVRFASWAAFCLSRSQASARRSSDWRRNFTLARDRTKRRLAL